MMDELYDRMVELADITNDCSGLELKMKRHGYLLQYMINMSPFTKGSVEYLFGLDQWMRIGGVLDNVVSTVCQTFTTADTFAKWLSVFIEFLVNIPDNLNPQSMNKSWYVQKFNTWRVEAMSG